MRLFITFEGGEGSGKTVQSRILKRRLSQLSLPVLLTREPGGTALGVKVSRLVKWTPPGSVSPVAELLLFNASRAQLVDRVIRPALEEGRVVICDRFADSTFAYQGYGRGLDMVMVKTVVNAVTGVLQPELTVLLDVTVETGFARNVARRRDRFEQEDLEFHRRVREGYLQLAAQEPERWLVVDAGQPKTKVTSAIWGRVARLLGDRGFPPQGKRI